MKLLLGQFEKRGSHLWLHLMFTHIPKVTLVMSLVRTKTYLGRCGNLIERLTAPEMIMRECFVSKLQCRKKPNDDAAQISHRNSAEEWKSSFLLTRSYSGNAPRNADRNTAAAQTREHYIQNNSGTGQWLEWLDIVVLIIAAVTEPAWGTWIRSGLNPVSAPHFFSFFIILLKQIKFKKRKNSNGVFEFSDISVSLFEAANKRIKSVISHRSCLLFL